MSNYKYATRQTDLPAPVQPKVVKGHMGQMGWQETPASAKAQAKWKQDMAAWKIASGQVNFDDLKGSQPLGQMYRGTPDEFGGYKGQAEVQERAFNLQRESGAIQRVRTDARSTDSRTSAAGNQARFKRDRRGKVRGNSLRIR